MIDATSHTIQDLAGVLKLYPCSVSFLVRTPIIEWHVVLSGMWFGVAPRTNNKNDMCLKEIGLQAKNMITVLCSIAR